MRLATELSFSESQVRIAQHPLVPGGAGVPQVVEAEDLDAGALLLNGGEAVKRG